MATPEQDMKPDIDSDIGPASLKALDSQESNPDKPASDKVGSVADQEEKGSKPWVDRTSRKGTKSSKPVGRFSFLKKKGPLTAIFATLVLGSLGLGSLSTAYLPISVAANLVAKFNTQDTSLSIRANKIISAKMTQNATSGSCLVAKVLCRFSRPSSRFLKLLKKSGITVFNGEKEIKTVLQWPIIGSTKNIKFHFTDSAGKKLEVEAKDLYKTLSNSANKEFQAAFHLAQRTRFVSVSDYVFKFVAAKFGFNTSDKARAVTNDEELKTKVNEDVKIDDGGAKAASGEGEAASESFVKKLLGDKAEQIIKRLKASSKGGAITAVAGIICLISDGPGLMIKVERAFQMIQLIKYGAFFLSIFGAIKSGEATPAETTSVGNQLTKVVNGNSAMDSFGMKYTMTGQTTPQNNNYTKYVPGMSMIALLGGIAAVTSSKAKIKACQYAANPVTGAIIDGFLASTGPIDWVALFGNLVIGVLITLFLDHFASPAIQALIDTIPSSWFSSIMQFFWGDLTQNLSGEKVGDALASGAAHVMGQTSNAGGNMPMTVDQAVAYGNLTKQVQLAYAEEDRATKSPLDASSPNTFLGSIVQKLIPYSTGSSSLIGSFSNTLSTMGKIVTGSFGMALQPVGASAASDPGAEYKQCQDPEIMAGDVAAGPFCNIIYGIPPEYLDKDPIEIVTELTTGKYAGNIDEDTGDPVAGKDLAKWIDLCTDGTTDEAANCMIKDDERATYALYTMDHRIQKSMDEEDTTASPTDTTPTDGTPTGDAQQLAQEILDNNKIDLSYTGDAGIPVKKDIQDAAAGKVGSAGAMTSTAILQLIASLGQNHTVMVSAIQSGGVGHSAGSTHYTGNAVDFAMLDGSAVTGRDSGSITIIKKAESIWPTGSAFGQSQCSGQTAPLPSGWSTFQDTCTHIHLQVPAGTP